MLSTSSYEWTAGIGAANLLSGVNSRYYDLYTSDRNSAKAGDALGSATATNPGCAGWHSATYSNWVRSSDGFFRGGSVGMFGFVYDNPSLSSYVGRAVAVCGAGL